CSLVGAVIPRVAHFRRIIRCTSGPLEHNTGTISRKRFTVNEHEPGTITVRVIPSKPRSFHPRIINHLILTHSLTSRHIQIPARQTDTITLGIETSIKLDCHIRPNLGARSVVTHRVQRTVRSDTGEQKIRPIITDSDALLTRRIEPWEHPISNPVTSRQIETLNTPLILRTTMLMPQHITNIPNNRHTPTRIKQDRDTGFSNTSIRVHLDTVAHTGVPDVHTTNPLVTPTGEASPLEMCFLRGIQGCGTSPCRVQAWW